MQSKNNTNRLSTIWELHHDTLKIFTPREFSFQENVNYLQRSSNECMFSVIDEQVIRAIEINSMIILIKISVDDEQTLIVDFLANTIPDNEVTILKIVEYIRDWFDLDTNLQDFYALAEDDQLLSKPVSHFFGLRNMGIPDLFEAIAWGILGQQINLPFAYTLKRRLVETYGQSMKWEGEKYWIFPEAYVIARLNVEDLMKLKMTARKAEYLIGVAQLIDDASLNKEKLLTSKDFKMAEKTLTNIRGIGPWTANYVLMRCLRYPNAFPIDDVGLHHAIKSVLKMDRKPTKNEIWNYAKHWTNWEAYATFYLWRWLY